MPIAHFRVRSLARPLWLWAAAASLAAAAGAALMAVDPARLLRMAPGLWDPGVPAAPRAMPVERKLAAVRSHLAGALAHEAMLWKHGGDAHRQGWEQSIASARRALRSLHHGTTPVGFEEQVAQAVAALDAYRETVDAAVQASVAQRAGMTAGWPDTAVAASTKAPQQNPPRSPASTRQLRHTIAMVSRLEVMAEPSRAADHRRALLHVAQTRD